MEVKPPTRSRRAEKRCGNWWQRPIDTQEQRQSSPAPISGDLNARGLPSVCRAQFFLLTCARISIRGFLVVPTHPSTLVHMVIHCYEYRLALHECGTRAARPSSCSACSQGRLHTRAQCQRRTNAALQRRARSISGPPPPPQAGPQQVDDQDQYLLRWSSLEKCRT